MVTSAVAAPSGVPRASLSLPSLTIALLMSKGGVGKSTLAVSLASAAHLLAGRRTVLIDIDPQETLIDWSEKRPKHGPLTGLTVTSYARALTVQRFGEIALGYDVAILDGPPRLDPITSAAAALCDVCIIPLRPGFVDVWALDEMMERMIVVDQTRKELGKAPMRRVFVLNGSNDRARVARKIRDELEHFGKMGTIAPVTIGNRVRFVEAQDVGGTVLTLDPEGAAAAEIAALWEHIASPGDAHG